MLWKLCCIYEDRFTAFSTSIRYETSLGSVIRLTDYRNNTIIKISFVYEFSVSC